MTLTNGLVVMTPTSVAKTGASSTATINSDGSVTFGSCETLSLNGVFTGDYDNYMIAVRLKNDSAAANTLYYRLRASGADNSTASSYVTQWLTADNTTVGGARQTQNYGFLTFASNVQRDGYTAYFFGPYLAQPTASRTVTVQSRYGGHIEDYATTHNQSTAYDGMTMYPSANTITGLLTVFGFNQ